MLEWKDLRVLVMVPLQKRNSESKVLLLKEQTDLEEPGQAWKLGPPIALLSIYSGT